MINNPQLITEISNRLHQVSTQMSILKSIAWPLSVQDVFFKNNAEKFPIVSYPPFDATPILNEIKAVQKLIKQDDFAGEWLFRISDKLEKTALLLSHRGQPAFFEFSEYLYGKPKDELLNDTLTTLDLANHFGNIFKSISHIDLGEPPEACVLAKTLAEEMEKAVKQMFGDLAPKIVLDANLASNALASRKQITIRPTACFTDNDIEQLIQHEAYIHVATSINGELQPHLKILSAGHAGTTKTQEGLAIFAEYITATTDLDRLRRLSDRVIAIQMAVDGANFIDVYRYFLEITDRPEQSFLNAKRVFRGGVIEGGAPFTKDMVYLEGLINVSQFLKVVMSEGKLEYLDLLFSGKLDLFDLPALQQLSERGLLAKPRFLPPWLQDRRFLLSNLSFLSFINEIDLKESKDFYERILK